MRVVIRSLFHTVIVSAAVVIAGVMIVDQGSAMSAAPDEPATTDYRLGPGDVIEVIVWKEDRLSQRIPVRPDGKISYPFLGDVNAADLTAHELKNVISRELSRFLANPMVTVIVAEVNNYKITVLGEVKRPGVYSLKSRVTVLEAIGLAGGLDEFAAKNGVVVKSDGRKLSFDYIGLVSGGKPDQNFYLDSADTVVVKTEVNHYKVSVVGEVTRPGVYLIKDHATVVEAITLAGGLSEFASRSGVVVVKSDGRRVPVDYNGFVSGKKLDQNIALEPGDTVVVR